MPRDPVEQREIDLADDAHRRDLMGGATSDDPAEWYGDDYDPDAEHDAEQGVGDFVDHDPDAPNVAYPPNAYERRK